MKRKIFESPANLAKAMQVSLCSFLLFALGFPSTVNSHKYQNFHSCRYLKQKVACSSCSHVRFIMQNKRVGANAANKSIIGLSRTHPTNITVHPSHSPPSLMHVTLPPFVRRTNSGSGDGFFPSIWRYFSPSSILDYSREFQREAVDNAPAQLHSYPAKCWA